jgi:hypothetical protein
MPLLLSRSYPDDLDEDNREHFWSVTSDGVSVGTITYQRARAEPVWSWSITVQDPAPDHGKTGLADTREEAMQQFRQAWDLYREWLGDERWLQWVKHVELVEARAKLRRY